MTELLVGTRKGLFALRGTGGEPMDLAVRAFAGETVEYAVRDPRTGRTFASVSNGQFGPRVMFTDDPDLGNWTQAKGPTFPDDIDASVVRTWVVVPGETDGLLYAGVDPAALFVSRDNGETWELNRGLWNTPTRPEWEPGLGGLALHSICPWPGDPSRLAVGISAAGVWLTEDGGQTWRTGYAGLVAGYMPEEMRDDTHTLCVHNMRRSPVRPERLFMQFHGSVYRSDDAGQAWTDISGGLPDGFGFPIAIDPADADAAFVIPLDGMFDRATPGGKVAVYETRDAGGSWAPRDQGLPQKNAWLTILRQAFGTDEQSPQSLAFGSTSGTVFASADGGAS
ncbi:MAG: exo-alpha-sialidase, partial [Actinomycetota bacterium]